MISRSATTRSPATPPRGLRRGSRIALVAPAGPVSPERLEAARHHCRTLELEPVVFRAACERHRYFAGTDEQRLSDLQAAFDDPSIDAVWALRGGYGTLRIVDRLDLARQLEDPIPFIGFSDNTTIHARHVELGVISFHGPHPGTDFPPETLALFRRVLCSSEPAGWICSVGPDTSAEPDRTPTPSPRPRTLVPGRAEAPLVGGNLAMLASMCGGPHAPDARGCILFLEDVGEPAYRVDRMLVQLGRAGLTREIAGLAFGRFTEGPDEEMHPVADVLAEFAERLGVPAVADLPFGHVPHNVTLPVGGLAMLDAGRAGLELTQGAVR